MITGLIAAAIYIVFALTLSLFLVIPYLTDPTGLGADVDLLLNGVIDNTSPLIYAFSLLSVALMLPAIILARLIMGPRPLGLLSSVAGRLRWRWMLRTLLPATVVFLGSLLVAVFLLPLPFGEALPEIVVGPNTTILIILTLVLVPLQATAEEYVFRGYLMQTVGAWLKHPAWAILLPIPLFVAGHLYDVWGLLDVAVFAIFAGWITWRTGGLEAAITAHVLNNATIFAFGALGLLDVNASEGSPVGVVMTAVTLSVYTLWVVRMADRGGVDRVRG